MRDILGTDLKLDDDFDISIVDGDLELVTGRDCLKQDIATGIATPLMLWGGDIRHGSLVQALINGGTDKWFTARLRRTLRSVFDKNTRVVKSARSPQIDIYHRKGKTEINMIFTAIDNPTEDSMIYIIDEDARS